MNVHAQNAATLNPDLERTGDVLYSAARIGAFGKPEYARLAQVSVSHLYNLRNGPLCGKQAALDQPTRPTPVAIGERRKPDPQGRPGFLRPICERSTNWLGKFLGIPRRFARRL